MNLNHVHHLKCDDAYVQLDRGFGCTLVSTSHGDIDRDCQSEINGYRSLFTISSAHSSVHIDLHAYLRKGN